MSDLEDLLDTQLRLSAITGYVREYTFALPRRWRADFFFPPSLLVEVEGGIYRQGRHQRPGGFAADILKYNAACLLGYRLLRVTGDMVNSGAALAMIEKALGGETR